MLCATAVRDASILPEADPVVFQQIGDAYDKLGRKLCEKHRCSLSSRRKQHKSSESVALFLARNNRRSEGFRSAASLKSAKLQ
jgi:hypothetical protein